MNEEEIERITDLLRIFEKEIENCNTEYILITKFVTKDLNNIFKLTEFLLQENQRLNLEWEKIKKDYGVDYESN